MGLGSQNQIYGCSKNILCICISFLNVKLFSHLLIHVVAQPSVLGCQMLHRIVSTHGACGNLVSAMYCKSRNIGLQEKLANLALGQN